MPDIAMCSSKTCSRAKDCYRHAKSGTIPDAWQSYSEFVPEEDGCFYPIAVGTPKRNKKKKKKKNSGKF
jgi:hypothetical protein